MLLLCLIVSRTKVNTSIVRDFFFFKFLLQNTNEEPLVIFIGSLPCLTIIKWSPSLLLNKTITHITAKVYRNDRVDAYALNFYVIQLSVSLLNNFA